MLTPVSKTFQHVDQSPAMTSESPYLRDVNWKHLSWVWTSWSEPVGMAAARAQAVRASADEKLESEIRQLRRYLDGANQDRSNLNQRILQQKMQKVSVAKDELINAHHLYGEKSEILLSDQAMRDFIQPKSDNAIDILGEAEAITDDLEKAK